MDRGDFHLTVIFVEVNHGVVKACRLLSNSLIEAVKNEKWAQMRNLPQAIVDEYLTKEIIKMDDLRGMAADCFSASTNGPGGWNGFNTVQE